MGRYVSREARTGTIPFRSQGKGRLSRTTLKNPKGARHDKDENDIYPLMFEPVQMLRAPDGNFTDPSREGRTVGRASDGVALLDL